MTQTEHDNAQVSVLIRSMNRDCLADALASVEAQTWRAIRVVVINATGKSHAPLPASELECKLLGVGRATRAEAANHALDAANTPLALFLDDDDLLDPHHIERLVNTLASQPDAPATYAGVRLEQNAGQPAGERDTSWVKDELLLHNTLPIHAVLFRMDAVNAGACRFDTRFDLLEDWDFWLQLAKQGDFIHVAGASATYRLGLGLSGLSESRDAQVFRQARETLWRKWFERVETSRLIAPLGYVIDELEQARWNVDQLHASEAELQQQAHMREGKLLELREHYTTLQEHYHALGIHHNTELDKLRRRVEQVETDKTAATEKTNAATTAAEQASAKAEKFAAAKIRTEAIEQQARLARAEEDHHNTQQRLQQLNAAYESLLTSRSVRVTHPLRWLGHKLRSLRGHTPPHPNEPDLPSARTTRDAPEGAVDVIVPVYKGLEETRACLESVWAATPHHPFRLLVINDASPEPEVTRWLREAANTRPMTLLENTENLGFVGTVNRGMAYSDSADVVLLNSDAEVANDWLDRMITAAYQAGERPVASVTPFSNNATICSYPRFCEDNALPEGYALPELDRLFAATNKGQSVEIPTGIGFCMYIRRDSLDGVGLFDEEHFGKGYGEENDFCMRSFKAGWRHMHALDVFAWHKGSVSFGASQPERVQKALATLDALHPEYHQHVHTFIGQDPACYARAAVEIEQLHRSNLPCVLMLNHQRGGGTETHCRELKTTFPEVNWLILRPDTEGRVLLSSDIQGGNLSLSYEIKHDWQALVAMLAYLGVQRLHWQHWLGFEDKMFSLADALGVEQDVTLHDFYSACPHITLTDAKGRYCMDASGECAHCREDAQHGTLDINAWRARSATLLHRCQRVIAPSTDTARRIEAFFPGLSVIAAWHPDNTMPQRPALMPDMTQDAPLRVAVLGALSTIKGADVLEAVAKAANAQGAKIEFRLFGFACRALAPLPNLTTTGAYQPCELEPMLDEWRPHVVWFPAQWPETYSYTLSTCLALGLPVAAPDLGAFGERLTGREYSWLCPWNSTPDEWVTFFTTLHDGKAPASNTSVRVTIPDIDTGQPPAQLDFYAPVGSESDAAHAYAAVLVTKHANQATSTPIWHPHLASEALAAPRRQRLLKALYWLRQHPRLRFISRRLSPELQRRVKSKVLGERS